MKTYYFKCDYCPFMGRLTASRECYRACPKCKRINPPQMYGWYVGTRKQARRVARRCGHKKR